MAKEEIALKDFTIRVITIFKILKRNLLWCILIICIGAPLGVFIPKKSAYSAKTTVLLNSGGNKGGFMSIASSLGFGQNTEMISYEKFEMIASSKKLINQVLKDSVILDGKKDLFSHHLIKKLKLDKGWEITHPGLLNINLNIESPSKDTIMMFLHKEIKTLYNIVEGKGELVEISSTNSNEDLTQQLSSLIAEKTITFFLDRSVSKDIRTRNLILSRIDSVRSSITFSEIKYAELKDKSHRSVKAQVQINLMTAQRKIAIQNELYLQLIKQKEMIDFKIKNANSGLEVIDYPNKPLIHKENSLVKRLLISTCLSFIGAISFVLIIFYGRKGLKSLKQL